MSDSIKLTNPEEVITHVKRITAIIALYQESLQDDAKKLQRLESMISETHEKITSELRGKQTAVDQVKSHNTDSNETRKYIQTMNASIEKYNENLQKLTIANHNLGNLQHEHSANTQVCTEMFDNSKILSSKIEVLLRKMIEAK